MQTNHVSVNKNPAAAPLLLDIRPIFAAGASPCSAIDDAVASLRPGQSLVLMAPFEPLPLFTKLAAQGFSHASEAQPDGSWRIEFGRTGAAGAAPAMHKSCCCSEEL